MPNFGNFQDVAQLIQSTAKATAEAMLDRLRTPSIGGPVADGSPLLTIKETSAYIRRSRSELHRLEHSGVLKPKRFGRRVLYARADVDNYIRTASTE